MSGVSEVGGLVGLSPNPISRCYALNSTIIRTSGSATSFGRVYGLTTAGTKSYNYANEDMLFETDY